jgi:hypothetical protein
MEGPGAGTFNCPVQGQAASAPPFAIKNHFSLNILPAIRLRTDRTVPYRLWGIRGIFFQLQRPHRSALSLSDFGVLHGTVYREKVENTPASSRNAADYLARGVEYLSL